MSLTRFSWTSLKTRVTLLTLAIFLAGTWSLALLSSQRLRQDTQRLLGEQQFATVSMVATEIDRDLQERLHGLKTVAQEVTPGLLGSDAKLQNFLEQRPLLQDMFNAGAYITRLDGTAAASVPLALGRQGENYLERDHVAAALREGRSTVSQPVIGKRLKSPVFALATPIREPGGRVVGALVGVIDMSQPSFLDRIEERHYGKTGQYFLVARASRLIITSSMQGRRMQALVAQGVSPSLDRFVQGFEGWAVYANPQGVQQLGSAKRLNAVDWGVFASIPTSEAFAPIAAMQRFMLLATLALSALVGALTWWMLRRNLQPLHHAALTLSRWSDSQQAPQALTWVRRDEVGQLIESFNALLRTLAQREDALRENASSLSLVARRTQSLLDLPRAAETMDEKTFMQHGLDLAEQLTSSQIGFIHFVHDDQDTMELVTWSHSTLQHYCQASYETHYPVSEAGLWADALRQRAPVIVNDYASVADKKGLPPGHAHLDRLISVPVIEAGLVRMLAGVGNSRQPYSAADAETMQLLANTVWHIVHQRRAEAAMRASEERHRLLADNSTDVIWTMNLQGQFTYVSPSVEKLRGYTSAEVMQQSLDQVLTPASLPLAQQALGESLAAMAQGLPFVGFRGELEQPCRDGSTVWTEINTSGMRTATGQFVGILGVSRDITGRKKSERKFNRLTQMYSALSRSNEAIVRSTEPIELFTHICRAIVQTGAMKMAWVGLVDAPSHRLEPVASFGDVDGYLTGLVIPMADGTALSQGPSATAVRQNEAVWCQDFLHDPRTRPWHERAAHSGFGASAALPLCCAGVPVGALTLLAHEVNAFDPEMQSLLQEMAADISFALDVFSREDARRQSDAALRSSEERYRAITQSASDAIITSDSAGDIVGWNLGAQSLFGYTEPQALGQPMTLLIPPQHRDAHLAGMQRLRRGEAPRIVGKTVELSGLRQDGQEFALELTLSRWESAGQSFVTAIIRDITERKAQQTQLKVAAQVFSQGREGITVTDAQGFIVLVNQAFTEITGYTQAEVLGHNPSMLSSGRQDAVFYHAMWDAIQTQGHWAGEIWNRRKNGSEYPQWLAISALRDEQGHSTHYVGSFSDLSDVKSAENRIQWLSHFDVLTGLPNRLLLKDRALQALNRIQRSGEALSVLLVGVDDFRGITDTLGHAASDTLLVELAVRLSASVREQDTVARLGGHEFVLVLPGTDASGAAHLGAELQGKLAQSTKTLSLDLHQTVSIGLACHPVDGADFDTLLKSAVIALHRAQSLGGDACQFYSAEMSDQLQRRDHLLKALRHAIELEQMELHYQPLVDLQTGQISGMEALARWHHPELGDISPTQFIALAEESGLINGLGEWVLRRACRDLRSWLDQGLQIPHVAVNVSPHQLHDNDFIGQVKAALAQWQLDPALIYLELTESALMEASDRSETMLQALKALGVKLSLDDFGTGYSSLSYLKRFPFDKVKIDQSFVRDITHNQSDLVLVKVIISMAHGLGMRVVAEGVETEGQCEIMRASVCDEIQGHFFSRAVSAQELQELFVQRRQLPPHLLRMRKPQRTLLLVDDEPNIVAALKRLLRRDGHLILTASSGAEGLDVLSKNKVDVIISDQRMPGMTGVDFLRAAKTDYPDTIRIVLSGYTELQSVTDAINEGAVYRFLTKPWDDEQLREHIRKAFEHKGLLEENRQLDIKIRTTNQELVAANRQLGEVLHQTRAQVERDETSLAIVRETLHNLPLAIIGMDDEGLIAFVNVAAQQLFAHCGQLLAHELAHALPDVAQALLGVDEGVSCVLRVQDQAYLMKWHAMGADSRSRGKIVTFVPKAIPT